jgi:hypothetical protein
MNLASPSPEQIVIAGGIATVIVWFVMAWHGEF